MDYEPFQTIRMVAPTDEFGPVSPLVSPPTIAVIEWDAAPAPDPAFADWRPVAMVDELPAYV